MVTHQIYQLLLLGSDLLLYAIDKPPLDKHPDHCAQLVPLQLCQTPLQRTQKYLLLSVGSVQSAPTELPLNSPSLLFFPSSPKKPFPPTPSATKRLYASSALFFARLNCPRIQFVSNQSDFSVSPIVAR